MAKRHTQNQSLGEVLKQFVQEHHLEKGLDKIEVRDAWVKLMGTGVNNYTSDIILKDTTLLVRLSSSVLREELSYGKHKIIDMMNEELGKELVKELILR
ncbi:DUF721 domain-containing protein [Sungkyunkwania multivorans]|uniref:DUF721 domain-containing protein n=1 Tax=Sungkyunkwania multivorans TaxID=1173618 RepID=A0ABW3CUA6_9FLAO